MPKVLHCLRKVAEMVEKKGFTVTWKKKQNVEFSPKVSELNHRRFEQDSNNRCDQEIQEAKKLEGVNLWQKKGSSNTTTEEASTTRPKNVISEVSNELFELKI